MLDKSLFISDAIHEREIKLADGNSHKMYFKELPAGEFRRYALANDNFEEITGADNEQRRIDHEEGRIDSMPRLIAESLVTSEGKRALTLEQAKKLKPGPMIAIFNAVQEVNSGSKKKKKTGDSGTS